MATKKTPTNVTPKKRAEAEGRKKMLARKAEARAARTAQNTAAPAGSTEPPPVGNRIRRPERPVKAPKVPKEPAPESSVNASHGGEETPSYGQFKGMTIEDLQQLYLNEVGRPTESTDRTYLQWKIRQTRAGKVRVGPRAPREGLPEPKQVPIRIEAHELEAIDSSWQVAGMHTRMQFVRHCIVAGLRALKRDVEGDEAKATISRALKVFES